MKNKTIEWVASLRDDMTSKWNVITNNISGRSKQLASFVSKNWLSTGATIAGAFYVAVQALEKVEKIAKKVDRAVEGAGGQSANAAKQIQQLGAQVENIKKLVDQVIVRGGLMALGVGKSVAAFFATLYTIILTPLALVEKALNALGITSSKTLQGLKDQGIKKIQEFSKGAMDAFSASFAASEKLGIGIETLKEKVDRLKKELEATEPGTKAYVQKLKEWDQANRLLEVSMLQAQLALAQSIPQSHIDKVARLKAQLEELGKSSGQKFFEKMTEDMRHFDAQAKRVIDSTLKDLKKAFGGEGKAGDDTVRQQAELEGQLRLEIMKKKKGEELAVLQDWYEKAYAMAGENAFLIADLDRVYAERRKEIDLEKAKQTWRQIGQIANQVMGLITQASAQSSQARVDQIEGERDEKLKAIDQQLAVEGLAEDEKKKLLAQRAAIEETYANQVRVEKERQFRAEKAAAIISAIIQTAVAVTEALPNVILAAIVAALGAAQVGIIASQPVPRFHGGGSYTNLGPDERQVIVRQNETLNVTRPDQQQGGSVFVTVNINAPGTSEQMVKHAIEAGLDRTGLTIDKYVVKRNRSVVLS